MYSIFLANALAQSNTNSNFDPEKMMGLIYAFMDAPTWKLGLGVFGIFTMAFLVIANYFFNRNRREDAAEKEKLRIQKQQEDNLFRMQRDMVASLMTNMDITEKQLYDKFVLLIKAGDYKMIYPKFATSFHEKIAAFVYDDKITPEDKAAKLILLWRNKEIV